MTYAWLVVDKDGTEWIYHDMDKPCRGTGFVHDGCWVAGGYCIELPKGSIQKLTGRSLTWDDEPFEFKDEE